MDIVSDEYELIKKIGSGSFGEVYLTKIKNNNLMVASKIEEKNNKKSKIFDEYKIYKRLYLKGLKNGIPKIYTIFTTPKFNILVMELLGDTLDNIYVKNNKQFNLSTILKLSYDLIILIENIHNCGYIHRDIKPNNFMFGINENKEKLYILDFGLSKKYMLNNKHIEFKSNKSLVGTARYTSINVHNGFEPSRRDDLISIGYMLIYFINGSLPWQGLKKLNLIGECKITTNITKLCKDIPLCYNEYLNYVTNLKFDERPNYNYIKNLFIEYSERMYINLNYNEIIKS